MSFPRSSIDVYPVSNFVVKEVPRQQLPTDEGSVPLTKKDNSALGRLLRLKSKFERGGAGSGTATQGSATVTSSVPSGPSPVRSVEGVILFHEHNHLHVLLLRYANPCAVGATSVPNQGQNNVTTYFYRLPGGTCRPDEDEIPCLLRKLGRRLLAAPKEPKNSHLCDTLETTQQPGAAGGPESLILGGSDTVPVSGGSPFTSASMAMLRAQGRPVEGSHVALNSPAAKAASHFFRVGEVLSQWYRPTYDRFVYPYRPAHVIMEKERRTPFIVHVEPHTSFYVSYEDPSGEDGCDRAGIHRQTSLAVGGHRMAKGMQSSGNCLKNSGITTKSASESYELVAVPLFDLYENAAKYGTILESLPNALSRFAVSFR